MNELLDKGDGKTDTDDERSRRKNRVDKVPSGAKYLPKPEISPTCPSGLSTSTLADKLYQKLCRFLTLFFFFPVRV